MRNLKMKLALGAGVLAVAGSAMADGTAIDTSAVTQAIVAAGVAIAACGAAYLAMKVGGKVWKWIASVL